MVLDHHRTLAKAVVGGSRICGESRDSNSGVQGAVGSAVMPVSGGSITYQSGGNPTRTIKDRETRMPLAFEIFVVVTKWVVLVAIAHSLYLTLFEKPKG
jgi:hypothetical protein